MSSTRVLVSSILLLGLLPPACALKARSTLVGEPTPSQKVDEGLIVKGGL
jgi:hypothetical protein